MSTPPSEKPTMKKIPSYPNPETPWEKDEKRNKSQDYGQVEEYIGLLQEPQDPLSPSGSPMNIHKQSTGEEPKRGSLTGMTRRSAHKEFFTGRFAFGGGFDLELWWRRTNIATRIAAVLTSILLFIAILYFIAGCVLIAQSFKRTTANPYICATPDCHKTSVDMFESMDESVDPCVNFYEFMCRNYQEAEKEGDIFAEYITMPRNKVELGKESILSKIMRGRTGDPTKDQHIKFYSTCLNYPKSRHYNRTAFVEAAGRWFGTSNFTDFEKSDKSMEQIAADIFKSVGHASFINMGFDTYPYILILEPLNHTMYFSNKTDKENLDFLRLFFNGLMPYLGLEPNTTLFNETVKDMVKGADSMSRIMYEIFRAVKDIKDHIDKDAAPNVIGDRILTGELGGLCPPMGIKLDYFKVLDLFIKREPENDTYLVHYISPQAHKFSLGLRACFSKTGNKGFTYPKTAFVALWIVDVVLTNLIGMDYKDMLEHWGFAELEKNHTSHEEFEEAHMFINLLSVNADSDIEHLCLNNLWGVLGYLPSARFVTSQHNNSNEESAKHIQDIEDQVNKLYLDTREQFAKIPPESIDWKEAFLAKMILDRRVKNNVGIPLTGGILDFYQDDLNFTDDFLRNVIVGLEYTVEKGRRNWIGSTDPFPTIRWFGVGSGPGYIKDLLFIPHYSRVVSARLVEEKLAAKNGKWETFMGRKQNNYLLYPMAIFDEDTVEILPLKHALMTLPLMRSILSLMKEADNDEKYPSVDWLEMIGNRAENESTGNSSEACSYMHVDSASTNETRHNLVMMDSDVSNYTWEQDGLFLSVLTAKLAYKEFKDEKERLYGETSTMRFNYDMDEQTKGLIKKRQLPGKGISKYDENKLFFMTHIHNICRASWKANLKKPERVIQQFHSLEATVLSVLMQMEEFSDAFDCPTDSQMHNKGRPRCFDWNP